MNAEFDIDDAINGAQPLGEEWRSRLTPEQAAEVERLAALSLLDYHLERKNAAKRLGLTCSLLDTLVRSCRARATKGKKPNGAWNHDTSVEDEIRRLNEEYCVIVDGGKTRVLHFEETLHGTHPRRVPVFMHFDDFRNLYLNRTVELPDGKDIPVGTLWLKHPNRKQYRGLVFHPGGEPVINGRLNLWRRWGVDPRQGDWSLMRRHIEEVLAAGDQKSADYILNWIAWAVQNPDRQAEVATVFRGKRGTGKGTLGKALQRIFGQHGVHISDAKHLSGHFNGHLRDCCFLFADEAYWPGDKTAEGSLKRLVTETTLFVEAKGRDGVMVSNMLHVMMASNEDWIVPAGPDERRFAVFDVSDSQMQREEWFKPLHEQLENGGYEAMLYDLLRRDIRGFHPRMLPKTSALAEQQVRSLKPEDAWWCELLETGVLWGADEKDPSRAVSRGFDVLEGERRHKRMGLFEQAAAVSPQLRRLNDHLLGHILSARGCDRKRLVMRRRGWTFPPLAEARLEWEKSYPGWKWRDPDLTDWQYAPPDAILFDDPNDPI